MSFECEMDKSLLAALGCVGDDMPIGESTWVVVNRNSRALKLSCSRIGEILPDASVVPVCSDFASWVENRMPELVECGALSL